MRVGVGGVMYSRAMQWFEQQFLIFYGVHLKKIFSRE